MKRVEFLIVLAIVIVLCSTVRAALHFPLHTIEGNSGIFITSTAFLANPPEKGKFFGGFNISASAIYMGDKDMESLAISENFAG